MSKAAAERPEAKKDRLGLRIASAAILAPATLAGVYAGGPVFAAVVAFCAIVMVFEWTRMVEGADFSAAFYGLALTGVAALVAAAAGHFPLAFGLCALAGALGAALCLRGSRRWIWVAFAAPYILAPSVALIWLRNAAENGRALAFILFLIVWAADTGGYAGGRLVGGPKLNAAVSPAKTWAGAAGGVLFGAIAAYAAGTFAFGAGAALPLALAGAALGLASIVGDMAESAFKRSFGVKDMSGFIPGHGGFLDRLDGMIFATTAMTLALFIHMIFRTMTG